MPLLNMMVVCWHVSPVVMSICDCTDYIYECGKKDATYTAEMFEEKVNDFDCDC